MDYRYTFYSMLQGFLRKRCYCNEIEDLEGSLHTCRDNVHDTVLKVSRVLLDSGKPKKHPRLPNKQTAELQTFWSNGQPNWSDEEFGQNDKVLNVYFSQLGQ